MIFNVWMNFSREINVSKGVGILISKATSKSLSLIPLSAARVQTCWLSVHSV